MRVLTSDQAQQLTHTYRETLPIHVLRYIGVTQPCRPLEVRKQVADWFPDGEGEEELDRLETILEWFEERGDVFSGTRGVLRCLPPYCVGSIMDLHVHSISLFGHPGVEDNIVQTLSQYGAGLISQLTPDRLGVTRSLELPSAHRQEIAERLRDLRIRIFVQDELFAHLGTVDDLELASLESFERRPPLGGVWYSYDPLAPIPYQDGRWKVITNWDDAGELVRWTPTESGGKHWMRRFFLHGTTETVSEISRDVARWWQFSLDDKFSRPTKWIYDKERQELVINGGVPQAVSQILRFIGHTPKYAEGFERRYPISPNQLPTVERVAGAHLRVKLVVTNLSKTAEA